MEETIPKQIKFISNGKLFQVIIAAIITIAVILSARKVSLGAAA